MKSIALVSLLFLSSVLMAEIKMPMPQFPEQVPTSVCQVQTQWAGQYYYGCPMNQVMVGLGDGSPLVQCATVTAVCYSVDSK